MNFGTCLRLQREQYLSDGLLDISNERRLVSRGISLVEWGAAVAGTLVETHGRMVSKTCREEKKIVDHSVDRQSGYLRFISEP